MCDDFGNENCMFIRALVPVLLVCISKPAVLITELMSTFVDMQTGSSLAAAAQTRHQVALFVCLVCE